MKHIYIIYFGLKFYFSLIQNKHKLFRANINVNFIKNQNNWYTF